MYSNITYITKRLDLERIKHHIGYSRPLHLFADDIANNKLPQPYLARILKMKKEAQRAPCLSDTEALTIVGLIREVGIAKMSEHMGVDSIHFGVEISSYKDKSKMPKLRGEVLLGEALDLIESLNHRLKEAKKCLQ